MIETRPELAPMLALAGNMRLELGGRPVPLSSRKALAILAYLALQPQRTESRERIAALLWSDSGAENGRAALRQTLRRLKTDLGPAEDLIEADRSMVRLTRPVAVDILAALDEAGSGRPPRLLDGDDADLGRLFADLADLDPDFNLWIAVQRERLGAQLIAKLEASLATAAEPLDRLALAEALLRADPTHEGACRAAMRAHLDQGDTAQAMRHYERLWQVLDADLDVEPSERTQALYVAIKQGQAAEAAQPQVEILDDLLAPIAILVEPVKAQDLPEAFAYFGTIFRDEMMAALSRFRDWLIIDGEQGSATPPTYRAYSLRIKPHARGDGIVVSMMLIDQADGRCVWAERPTATLDSLPALHRTALRNLAVALNIHLSAPRLATSRELASPMGRKYEQWMQAQALMSEWRADYDARAEAILRDLIATTPTFAPAMVALAQIMNARPIVHPGLAREPGPLAESLALTARAVSLDPLDSRTHLSRSWSHAIAGAHSAALSHLDLALDLNENDPWTIISAALGFAFAGDLARSRDLVAQAGTFGMRYSRVAQGYIAVTLYLCGDCPGAVAAAEVAGDAITNLPAWAAASHMCMGDVDGAAFAMQRFLKLALPAWVGPRRPAERDAIDWFMGCFPIRSPEVRGELRTNLVGALEQKRRLLGSA